jgi:lactoylglutathione lyase
MSVDAGSYRDRAQPESLRGRALSISLTVKDLQQSLKWYRDVLGFVVDREYERDGKPFGVSLKAGSVAILINQDDGAKGANRVKGEGISFMITTAQSVDEIAKRVKDNGGTLDTEPTDMRWGTRAFRLRDPDGFKLTISSERT